MSAFSGLISTVFQVAKVNPRNDDDLVDRMHHRYTVIFMVIFTVVVSTTQYVGNPIHCWCPAFFTGNHEGFTNRICWISNTYYLADENHVPGHPANRKQHIGYYQWVPVMLLIQAFLFYTPCLLWRVFGDRSGINVNNLVEAAETIQNALYPERRDKTIKYMIRHMDHYLNYQRDYRGGCCSMAKMMLTRTVGKLCGNRYGNYLVLLYLGTKALYMVNVIGQLYMLGAFLGVEYNVYGLSVLVDLIAGNDWVATKAFPRITLCDFSIRQMGTVHPHTVQCVLPINLFNEKIYIFLWFWMIFIAAATAVSFVRWTWTLMFRYSRLRYIQTHLLIMKRLDTQSERELRMSEAFTEDYLRQDGIFVLKLVAKNSTDLVVADIVSALWDNYKTKPFNLIDDDDMVDEGTSLTQFTA